MSGMTGGDITTLTGNSGGLITASGSGNFNIVGSGSIVVTGAPATHTLTISGGGVTGMTEHAMVVGNAAGGITSLAVATDGQLPIGSTGNNPVLATLTAGNNIGITNAAGSITIKVNGTTNHSLQVGNVGGSLSSLAVGGTGVILQGVTANDPTWSTATYPSTVALGDVLVASADNVIGVVNDVTHAGYVLTANAGAAPSFQAVPTYTLPADVPESIVTDSGTVTPALNSMTLAGGTNINTSGVGTTATVNLDSTITLTGVNSTTFDTNVVAAGVTLSGTTLSADGTDADININITAKGTGQVVIDDLQLTTDLAVTEGGTGQSTLTAHGVLIGEGTSGIGATSAGTANQFLMSQGAAADPTWTTAIWPDSVAIGDVLVASAANTVSVVSGATTAGHVLMANGAGSAPTFQALPASGITSVSGTANQVTASTVAGAVTLSTPATFIAPGTIAATTTVTAGTNLVSTAGNLELPETSATVGQIKINSSTILHRAGSWSNIFAGQGSGNFTTTGTHNSCYGISSGTSLTNGRSNTLIGRQAGDGMTSGSYNTIIGSELAGHSISTSSYNIFIGSGAGYNATGGECIYIGSDHVTPGETNVLKIGSTDSGFTNITKAYILGIYGVTPGGTKNVALVDSNGQLGSVATLPTSLGGMAIPNALGNYRAFTLGDYTGGTAYYQNIAIGYYALGQLGATTAGYNIAIGGSSHTAGSYTFGAGYNYTTTESNNILLQAEGVAGDNNILRIADSSGTGVGQLNKAYICGIYGRTPAGTLNVALIDSNNQLGSVASLGVAQGGTGAATLTDHGILLGSGTGAITPLGAATDGQLPIGSTGADPVLATITAGSGISVTNGAGSITIAATGGSGMSWSEITAATKTIVNNEAYVANRGTLITFTLPTTAALGTEFKIQGKGAGLWKIAQGAGQQIYVGSSATASGAGGYLEATDAHDAITLVCITADTVWATEAVVGNITVA